MQKSVTLGGVQIVRFQNTQFLRDFKDMLYFGLDRVRSEFRVDCFDSSAGTGARHSMMS